VVRPEGRECDEATRLLDSVLALAVVGGQVGERYDCVRRDVRRCSGRELTDHQGDGSGASRVLTVGGVAAGERGETTESAQHRGIATVTEERNESVCGPRLRCCVLSGTAAAKQRTEGLDQRESRWLTA